MKKASALFVVLLLCSAPVADVPGKTEQFIYSIEPFNSLGYDAAAFCIRDMDTIYLAANAENFIQPRKSLVYFWPLTNTWQLDTDNLYETFDGYLQVRGKTIGTKNYALTMYTWSRQAGEYEDTWQVFLDKAAEQAAGQFDTVFAEYSRELAAYQEELPVYEAYVNTLLDEIGKLRAAGKDVSRLLKKVEEFKAPVLPEPPDYYVYPLRKAFVLNLPAGQYTIQFRNPEGLIMEDSEKNLVVFGKRRENCIGYEIVPGDKWTKPEKSHAPDSVLYVDGTTTLFFKPFYEDEVNDLYYNKMLNNQGKGNPGLYKWQEIKQVPGARMEVTDNTGTARIIKEIPFVIEQVPGTAPGYTIVPYDPEGKHKTEIPNFKAFPVFITAGIKFLKIRLLDKNSNYFASSNREIRIVTGNKPAFILVILAFMPPGLFILVLINRNKKLKSPGRKH